MKKILLLLFLVPFVNSVIAQQDPRFSQFMYNKLVTNPAFAGSKGLVSATLIYRHEWVGFEGEPVTQNFSIHSPFEKLHGGIGLSVVNDKLGFDRTTGGLIHYSYRTNAGEGILGIGLQAGFFLKSMDASGIVSSDTEFDAAIPNATQSGGIPDVGIGVYYNTKKVYFGLSASHVIEGSASYSGSSQQGTYSGKLQLKRHYYLITGYEYEMSPKLSLLPSILIKSDAASTQLDVNTNLAYKFKNRQAWAGLSYGSGDLIRASAFLAMIFGIDISPNLHFGYSYDVTPTAMNLFGNRLFDISIQTHEIMLGYDFSIIPPAKPIHIIRTPRFL